MRKPTSVIWKIDKEELTKIVQASISLSDIMRTLGMNSSGGSFSILKKRLDADGINWEHIKNTDKWVIIGKNISKQYMPPLEEVLVENCSYRRGSIKKRLLDSGYKKKKCEICGFEGEWQGKPIVMILDHINGVNNDNRLENLRMVCPMCNSQLDTHSGKNNKNKNREPNYCKICGKAIGKGSILCLGCSSDQLAKNPKTRRVERPPYEQLTKEIEETSMEAVARKYGVSGNAVRKWIKWYEKYGGIS